MPDQKDRLLKLYGDNYESHIKGANYLLAAHAAGFVGCFALIKDYATTSQFKGVGFFIVLFGIGLLSGIFYYISLALSRATALNSVMNGREPDDIWKKTLLWVNVPSLVVSVGSLFFAIVAVMIRFARL